MPNPLRLLRYGIGVIVRGSGGTTRANYNQRFIELVGKLTGVDQVSGETYFERYVLAAPIPPDQSELPVEIFISLDGATGATIKGDTRGTSRPAVRLIDLSVGLTDAAQEADLRRRMAELGIDLCWIVRATTDTTGDLISKFTPV